MTSLPPTPEARRAEMESIAAAVRVCTLCKLHEGRKRAVPGAGPVPTDIMFIGEGPGYHEDQQGLPFVGNSGKYLEKLLAMINLTRDDVFIANVVKCRPPENRDPETIEVKTCTENYLFRQIALIDPKVIVTLGRFSMGLFFPGAKITAIHGKVKWDAERCYLPLFHPAAVLRTPSLEPAMADDFKQIPALLAEWQTRRQAPPPPPEPPAEPPQQMTLF
jgi:DNA polymerase